MGLGNQATVYSPLLAYNFLRIVRVSFFSSLSLSRERLRGAGAKINQRLVELARPDVCHGTPRLAGYIWLRVPFKETSSGTRLDISLRLEEMGLGQ